MKRELVSGLTILLLPDIATPVFQKSKKISVLCHANNDVSHCVLSFIIRGEENGRSKKSELGLQRKKRLH